MTFTATIDKCGQVTFPKEALDALGVVEDSTFEFEVAGSSVILKPQFDARAFDDWAAKYMGSGRERLLADGYSSVDDFMKAIRPEW